MDVVVDTYWLSDGPPSGRNVVDSILSTWQSDYPEDDLVGRGPRDIGTWAPLSPLRRNHALSNLFLLYNAPGQVMLTQNFPSLRARGTQMCFVHDLIFMEHPEWFTKLERAYLGIIPRLLSSVDAVLTSSRSEKTRIERLVPAVRGRVHAVGLAVPVAFSTAMAVRPPRAPAKFLLAVGRLNVRKNLARLITALQRSGTISSDLPLVVVGTPNGLYFEHESVLAARRAGAVQFMGSVSPGQLKWLYRQARLFIFPSLDEGFGLPVLEAASQGTQIIASDIPALREFPYIAGYFDPTSSDAIVKSVEMATSAPDRPRYTETICLPTWHDVVSRVRKVAMGLI